MKKLAFLGWQNYTLQPLEKGQKHKDFKAYLKMLGLGDHEDKKISDEDFARTVAELSAKAEGRS